MSVSFKRKSFWPPDGCQKNCIIAKRNARVRSTIPIRENLVWRDRTPNDRPFTPQENQCLILHFLVSLGAQEQPDIALIFHINVEINWQLSKQDIRWPVSPDRTAGSSVDPSRSSIFEVIRWQITSFKWSQAQVYFFQGFISNMLCLCHYGPALLGFWFQTDLGSENSSSFFKSTGGEDLILPWSRVGHALRPIFILWLVKIWQLSSCGKFMQHLESCLLWQLKLTEFCVNLWCF